jgi:hypothetical protein
MISKMAGAVMNEEMASGSSAADDQHWAFVDT